MVSTSNRFPGVTMERVTVERDAPHLNIGDDKVVPSANRASFHLVTTSTLSTSATASTLISSPKRLSMAF